MEAGKNYDAARDIPDLSGKVILVTGGTAGLGKETITTLAKHNPAQIYFTGRKAKSAASLIEDVKATGTSTKVSFLECDFESFESIAAAAKIVMSAAERLDILLCNAGVMAVPPKLTTDGYEIQFGINHMGHALLIDILTPLLLKTAETSDVRVISTASDGHRFAGNINFKTLHTTQDAWVMGPMNRYSQSKLANVLYAQELARRYPQLTSVSIHPGVIMTSFADNSTWLTQKLVNLAAGMVAVPLEEGVKNGLWTATIAKDKLVNGAYYEPVGKAGKMTAASRNAKLAGELWDWTQAELKKWNKS